MLDSSYSLIMRIKPNNLESWRSLLEDTDYNLKVVMEMHKGNSSDKKVTYM